MKHITSRLLALLLTLAMIISMMPAVYAADEDVAIVENEQPTVEETIVENSTEDTTVEPAKAVEANLSEGETALTSYVTVNGAAQYATLDEAIAAAEPVNGVITYTITGKIEVASTGTAWIQVLKGGLTGVTEVKFVGDGENAEISLTNPTSVLADQTYDIDVSFEDLTLSHPNGEWVSDLGHTTNYFACVLRNTDAANNTVTYTNCVFPNGACNNLYGKTVFDGCKFTNATSGKYNLWNYGGNTEVRDSAFTGTRGIKTYNEGTLEVAPTVAVENTTFTGLREKAAIVASKATDITLDSVSATGCNKGLFQKAIEGSTDAEEVVILPSGSSVSGTFKVDDKKGVSEADNALFNVTAGKFDGAINENYVDSNANYDATTGEVTSGTTTANVATVGSEGYKSLEAALDAAKDGDTVTLLADTTEDVTINKSITLDLGGKTLTNTNAGKATISVTGGTVKVQNGNVVGGTSYYNIEVTKGSNANLTLEGVTATAGNTGSSMIDNFGDLTINSGSYTGGLDTIKNEPNAKLTITGGKFELTYGTSSGFNAVVFNYGELTISGGEFIQSNTTSKYAYAQVIHTDKDKKTGAIPSTTITGGTFVNKRSFSTAWTVRETNVAVGCTEVKGGTFNKSVPDSYFPDGYFAMKNADGMYEKAGPFDAKISNTGYETLADAIMAAKSTSTIYLLRDVESDRVNLDDKNISIDLNGHTLTSTADYGVMFCAKNGKKIKITGTTAGSKLVGTLMVTAGTDGQIEIKGGTYENSQYCPIYINGSVSTDSSTLSVKDAVINTVGANSDQDAGCAVYLAGYCTSTFTGTTITAPVTGIEIRAGKLTLKNCTVTGGGGEVTTSANGNGTTVTNAALAISQHTTKKPIDVTITGGEYTATAAIYQTDVQGTGSADVKATVASGTFNGTVSAETNNTVAVKGGKFTSAVPENCCAAGFVPTQNTDGSYGVKVDEGIANEKALRKAFYEAATNGSVTKIKLTGDITLEMLYAAENFGTEKLDDNAAGDTFNRYKLGVHPTAEDPTHWNPLVVNQTQEQRVVYGAYYHMGATDERIARLVVKAGQNIELDLNGHTIQKAARATHGDWSEVCTDIIGNYGTLTVIDSSTGETKGTIRGNGYFSCKGAVLHNYAGATMTVGAVNVDGNAAGMTAGTGQYVIRNEGGSVTINGTNVFDTATSASLLCNDSGTMKVTGSATLNHPATKTVNVKGGTVEIENAAITSDAYAIFAAGGETKLTGALTISASATDKTAGKLELDGGNIIKTASATVPNLPDGYKWVDAEDGTQKLAKRTYVASVGDNKHESLVDAFAAAENGQTVKLLADVTLNAPVEVPAGKAVTLDLNGKKLSTDFQPGGTKHYYAIDNYGTFTLLDSSTAQTSEIRARGIENLGSGKMVIESGKIVAVDASGGAAIWNLADLTIQGGTFVAEYAGTSKDQFGPGCVYNEGSLTINGGIFTSANKRTYAVVSKSGTVTIDPVAGKTVEISGAHGGVGIDGGTATINGGSYASSEYYGLYVSGDAGTADVTVTGGVFKGKEYSAFIGSDGESSVNSTLKIKGGTFEKPIHAQGNTVKGAIQVSGGTFYSAVPEEYCAAGYIPQDKGDGIYGVKEGTYVAEYNGMQYDSLQAAIDAASHRNGGQTEVTLLGNVTIKETVTFAKEFSAGSVLLNLGGYTLTGEGCRALQINKGNLYLENGTVTSTGIINSSSVIRIGSNEDAYAGVAPSLYMRNRAKVLAPASYGVTIFGSKTVSEKLTVAGNASIEATGPSPAISGNGDKAYHVDGKGTKVIITGSAVISATNNYAIYHPDNGSVELQSSATVTGKGGIQMCSGTLTISDSSKVEAVGKANHETGAAGPIYDVAAISVVNRSYPGGAPVVTIKGTPTITTTVDGEVIHAYTWSNNAESEWAEAGDYINVSGGTYNKQFNEAYLAADCTLVSGENGYTVEQKPVAEYNGTQYTSLAQAILDANKAGTKATVKLLEDVTLTSSLGIGGTAAVTLNLNGKTLTLNGAQIYTQGSAAVTIKKGTIKRTDAPTSGDASNFAIQVMNGSILLLGGSQVTDKVTLASTYGVYNYGGLLNVQYADITTDGWSIAVHDSQSNIGRVIIGIGGTPKITSQNGNCIGTAVNTRPNVTIHKGTLTSNGTNWDAGPIYWASEGTLTIEGGTFTASSAEGSEAAAVYQKNGTVKISGTTTKLLGSNALVVQSGDGSNPDTIDTQLSGGTYSTKPDESWLAAGKEIHNTTDGKYKVEGAYVVEVTIDGTATKYDSWLSAFKSSTAQYNNATVKLLKDIETTTLVSTCANVTIDFSGHTLKVSSTDVDAVAAITAFTRGTAGNVTLKDSVGNGGMVTTGVYGVTVSGTGATATVESGTYNCDTTAVQVENGTAYIKGGTFKTEDTDKRYVLNCKDDAFAAGTAKMEVTGGTFHGFDPSANPEGEGTTYVKPGYVSTDNGDGTYTVDTIKVAQIGETKYATLTDAIAAAKDGDTITLLDNVDLTEPLIIKDKTITLDLNGKTISNSTDIWNEINYAWSLISVRDNGDLTINDTAGGGTLKAKENDCFALDVYAYDTKNVENTKLTINAGNYVGNISAVYAFTGKVTINGGHFSIQQKESGSDPYRLTLNCYDKSYKAGRAGFTVNGGTFENFDPRNNPAEGAGTSFVAEGVGVNKDESGNFMAVPNMAAQIVDADGNSVAAYDAHFNAIAAAKDGETVILLSNRLNYITNTIDKNITIDLNGKTLSLGNNNPFFRTNGEVTIQNGTITNTSNYACAIVNAYNKLALKNVKITGVTGDGKHLVNVYSNAEVTIDKDTVLTASGSGVAVFVGSKDAADSATFKLNVYGKVIQNSQTYAICGNGSYKGTSTINIYDGAEVKSPTCVAMFLPQAGVANIYGGLVEGKCAIGIKSGALNISGGTVRGTVNDHVLSDDNSSGSGISYDGSAIIVDSRAAGYAGNVKINVTGGTVESCYSNAIREIGNDPSVTQLAELNVTGGNVFGASSKTENVTNDMLVRDISVKNVSVSGGTFNHEVQPDYCAIGFVPCEHDTEIGKYTVKKGNYEAYYKDGDTVVYGTLAELLSNDATEERTITLLKNVTASYVYLAGRTVELDGKTLEITKILIGDFGSISDSSDGNGLVKVAADKAVLDAANGQMPIYDSAKGGYRLFNCEIRDLSQTVTNGVKLYIVPRFKNMEAYDLLKSGNAHNVVISVEVSWKNSAGDASQTFAFKQELIDDFVNSISNPNPGAFTLVLTGLDSDISGSISNVMAQSGVTSGTGVSISGKAYSIS